jgi:hypothetical protein
MWTVQGNIGRNSYRVRLRQVAINSGNPYPFLQFGGTTDSIGIQFIASTNQPAGYSWVFKWVNLISDDNATLTDSNGSQARSLGTGFDTNGTYPFPNITANATFNPKDFSDVCRKFGCELHS